jgi:hypothetical protein
MKRNASLHAPHRHFMIGIPILANHAMLALSFIQVKSNAKLARQDAANVAITLLNSKSNAKPASPLLFSIASSQYAESNAIQLLTSIMKD